MLAEKFFLVLEMRLERNSEMRVQSTSPHLPVVLLAKAAQPTTKAA
jgi:hypothetical protein